MRLLVALTLACVTIAHVGAEEPPIEIIHVGHNGTLGLLFAFLQTFPRLPLTAVSLLRMPAFQRSWWCTGIETGFRQPIGA